VLNAFTPVPSRKPSTLIPHGDYRRRFEEFERCDPILGRILFLGIVRPYKGVEGLLCAFRHLTNPDVSLRIVGRPDSETLAEAVHEAVREDARISCDLRMVSDAEMVKEFSSAQLVVLPYEKLHNSGVLFVALSLNRPILTPDDPVIADLSKQIGPGWIYTYTGQLTPDVLQHTLIDVQNSDRTVLPRLHGRDWATIALEYSNVYRPLLRTKHARRRSIRQGARE
jgi:beta-1,4-mannosyltransferase